LHGNVQATQIAVLAWTWNTCQCDLSELSEIVGNAGAAFQVKTVPKRIVKGIHPTEQTSRRFPRQTGIIDTDHKSIDGVDNTGRVHIPKL
jgi:hypothetical protein